ncbi:hypothetical protein [Halobacterium sp. KA-6]|uniref:hypothetical protein n=1 Tax=Halobacterium sp. KA-6 TaxID=2896368 RepID=UPI001E53900A|nr:hypothetical protein [Halobacterium sp. KA-6]MCD2204535.1 hypothetical protein [Halobacterium sp. KA-6]
MTDAALSVTQRAVEQFSERYLETVGCKVNKKGNQWNVTIPENAETGVATSDLTLVCSTGPDDVGDDVPLNPESSFFDSLLDEAAERWPTGKIAVTAADTEITLPPWIVNSEASVESANFTPYYDRTALVVLFRVSIETVSDYQTELLRTSAIDTHSKEILTELAETVLGHIDPEQTTIDCTPTQVSSEDARQLLGSVRADIVSDVEPTIDEIHEAASRSADAEIEEYRQLQQQRIEELEEEKENLERRIDDLNDAIEANEGQADRAEALKQRRDLRSELGEIETELDDLRQRRERGFPEKQHEIRDRHALEVVVEPVTLTEVVYERGEIDLTLTNQGHRQTLTVGYGSGVGVTEDVECDRCGEHISEVNPLQLTDGRVCCSECVESGLSV